jgi:hypothetical protein
MLYATSMFYACVKDGLMLTCREKSAELSSAQRQDLKAVSNLELFSSRNLSPRSVLYLTF